MPAGAMWAVVIVVPVVAVGAIAGISYYAVTQSRKQKEAQAKASSSESPDGDGPPVYAPPTVDAPVSPIMMAPAVGVGPALGEVNTSSFSSGSDFYDAVPASPTMAPPYSSSALPPYFGTVATPPRTGMYPEPVPYGAGMSMPSYYNSVPPSSTSDFYASPAPSTSSSEFYSGPPPASPTSSTNPYRFSNPIPVPATSSAYALPSPPAAPESSNSDFYARPVRPYYPAVVPPSPPVAVPTSDRSPAVYNPAYGPTPVSPTQGYPPAYNPAYGASREFESHWLVLAFLARSNSSNPINSPAPARGS